LLPAGAFAGWGSHPLESAAFSRRTQIAAIAGRVPNGSIRPFDALQDPPSEQAGSARKRSLAEGVCCARRGQSRANWNFCFGRGLSQRSPRSASHAFAISRLGHQVLDSHHWGGAQIAPLLPLAIRLPPPPRPDPGAARVSRSRRPVPAACATCDPRHSGRRRNVPHL
jgi:hypothetical protein